MPSTAVRPAFARAGAWAATAPETAATHASVRMGRVIRLRYRIVSDVRSVRLKADRHGPAEAGHYVESRQPCHAFRPEAPHVCDIVDARQPCRPSSVSLPKSIAPPTRSF